MAEADRTDQEIDNAIREWKIKFRDLPEALGVSRDRVQERWERFRQEIYRRIADGKSTPEIVAEVGLPRTAVAAFRARWTQGYRPEGVAVPEPGSDLDEPESADVENAVVTTFGLERDLQRSLRENIAQLEPGLRIIDSGHERRCTVGLIDILCEGSDGALVVVELKAGLAKDAALGQLLGYMGAVKREMTEEGEHSGRPVRGILVAKEFDDRVRHASLAVPKLRLISYQIQFAFEDRGLL
jgi:Endonuclease NucS